jgi:hypothetical protein
MTAVGNSDSLKQAAADIRAAVAEHGNVHPVVLQKLESYVEMLVAAGNNAEADKLKERAQQIRKILSDKGISPLPAASAVPAPATPAPAPTPSPAPAPAPAPDAGDDEMSNEALEAAVAKSVSEREAAAPAPSPSSNGAPDPTSDQAITLYNSGGEHIAVAVNGYIFSPEGKNLGRYQADFEVFVDRTGRYMGQIYEENRLVRDANFRYASFNFGDKGNEGDRAGWGRTADIFRTLLPPYLDDVKFSDDD